MALSGSSSLWNSEAGLGICGMGDGECGKGICVMGIGWVERAEWTTTEVAGGDGIPPKLGMPYGVLNGGGVGKEKLRPEDQDGDGSRGIDERPSISERRDAN